MAATGQDGDNRAIMTNIGEKEEGAEQGEQGGRSRYLWKEEPASENATRNVTFARAKTSAIGGSLLDLSAVIDDNKMKRTEVAVEEVTNKEEPLKAMIQQLLDGIALLGKTASATNTKRDVVACASNLDTMQDDSVTVVEKQCSVPWKKVRGDRKYQGYRTQGCRLG